MTIGESCRWAPNSSKLTFLRGEGVFIMAILKSVVSQQSPLFLHKQVTDIFEMESYTKGMRGIGLFEKSQIEKTLKVNVQQVSLFDFIDIAFPNADGYLCIFQNKNDRKRNDYMTKEELATKLPAIFNHTWGMNVYVSYSTYNKKFRGYETKETPLTYMVDGKKNQVTACDIATKTEYVVKVKKTVKRGVRVQENIQRTYMLAQDLDFYKLGVTEKQAMEKIAELVHNQKIVCPTFVVYTGRGIQLLWCVKPFKNIEGFTNDRQWRAIQEDMIRIFDEVGLYPDTVVKAPNAVTRVAQTPNIKSKTLVKAFYTNSMPLTLQDLVFFHGVIPYPDRKVKPPKEKPSNKEKEVVNLSSEVAQPVTEREPSKVAKLKNWNDFTLNRNREEDIFIFVREAVKQGLNIVGKRTWLATILRFHALVSSGGDSVYAQKRFIQFWNLLTELKVDCDNSFEEMEERSDMAQKYYDDWVNDKWDKSKYKQGGLFYKNATLLDELGIRDNYYIQWKMNTIKIKNKPYEAARKRFERLEQGKVQGTAEEYNARRKEESVNNVNFIKVKSLFEQGMKQVDIVKKTGLSKSYVSKIVRKIKDA